MKNSIIKLKCIDMTIEGQGICRYNDLVVFVKGLIIDEVANVKIISIKKNIAYGIIDKLIDPSPYREETDCPIAYKCGGCDFRHIKYDYQLLIKKRLLKSTFDKFKLNLNIHDVVKCDDPLFYRNKCQLPVNNNLFGFYRKYSNDIVEFDKCYIESKTTNDIISDIKGLLKDKENNKDLRHIIVKHGLGSGEIMIGFVVKNKINLSEVIAFLINKYKNIKSILLNINNKDTNVILGDKVEVLYGNDYIIDEFEGLKFKISLKSFYQVNYYQMIKLYKAIKDITDLNNKKVLDLFCGIGTISLYLSKYVSSITGIEIVEDAIKNAKDNAVLNDINNANFVVADANKSIDKYLKDIDIVVVDPPRKGLGKELIDSLINSKVKEIIYVSCNPATLARDLNLFKDHYEFKDIHPVDMFPYTVHTECIVGMHRK